MSGCGFLSDFLGDLEREFGEVLLPVIFGCEDDSLAVRSLDEEGYGISADIAAFDLNANCRNYIYFILNDNLSIRVRLRCLDGAGCNEIRGQSTPEVGGFCDYDWLANLYGS